MSRTEAPPRREIPYRCPACGVRLGSIVEELGNVYLDTGGWMLVQGKRYCHACGAPVHVRLEGHSFEELARRVAAETVQKWV